MLRLNDVSYMYEGTKNTVLKNINASFESGKLYAIVGKSGAGKTTLLSLISGLDVATNGEILYKDRDISKINRDEYRSKSIGVIFQSFNLLTNATAVENIELSMNISSVPKKQIKDIKYKLLDDVGIDKETANRKILKLSGGEQQRVAIARAISHNPDIIIADEPTGNLDVDTEKCIMDIFSNIAREKNKCVIIVTHSNKVSSYANEVLKMSNGTLISEA